MLKGLNVLVTRPAPEGKKLCALIQQAGGKALHFPTLDFRALPLLENFQLMIKNIYHYEWLIFTSPRSVDYSVEIIRSHWPVLPDSLKIAAVGHATAESLRARDIKVHACPGQDWSSEGLLALPEFQSLALKKIAIIKGVGGRELLAQCLEARGAKVDLLNVYQRIKPQLTLSTESLAWINVVLCTSTEGMNNLIEMLGKGSWQKNILLVVVSQRMLKSALALGFSKLIVASNASHQAVMETLEHILRAEENGK